MLFNTINEAFEHKRKALGVVKFHTSTLSDPFIIKIIKFLSHNDPTIEQKIIAEINEKQKKNAELAQKAPILFSTMKHNIVEDTLFNIFQTENIDVPGAPSFSNILFQRLIRNIEANHEEMFPMRSFIDDRPLPQKKIDYTFDPPDAAGKITTAAATPGGVFYFNVPFMQKLLDWAYLKGLKPNRPIYKSNGGPFPDEYAYLEFLIMHEFMHYTNDDFYYYQTIANANNNIINWVGDFRSNYLLTKSGYAQLPIGLYNDEINYDRQKSYIDMYNLVKEEFEKLNDDDKKSAENAMDDAAGDDHKPGQEEGQSADNKAKVAKKKAKEAAEGKDINDDMSEHGKKEEEKVAKGAERDENTTSNKDSANNADGGGHGGDGGGSNAASQQTDIKVIPTYNWKTILRKCIPTEAYSTEENYSKINRRAISSLDIARQTGAGYLPPAETNVPLDEIHVAFVMDTSGSMSHVVPTIMANAVSLLKNPIFNKSVVAIYKFASSHTLQKINIGTKKSATCNSIVDKPKQWPDTAAHVFEFNFSGGTSLDAALYADLQLAIKMKYNIILCTDDDILYGDNYTKFNSLIKQAPRQVFVIFDNYETYAKARKLGTTTSNMSHF